MQEHSLQCKSEEFMMAVEDFLSHLLIERNLSQTTVDGYYFDLRLFGRYLDNQFEKNWLLAEIDINHIRGYLVYLRRERDNLPKTVNRKIFSLKTFFRFVLAVGIYSVEKDPTLFFRKMKTAKTLPQYLTLTECRLLLKTISQYSSFPHRDKAIYQVFLQTGCRVSELTGLKLNDLYLKVKSVKFFGKGRKERIVPLVDKTIADIIAYLKVRRPTIETDRVFLNTHGRPLSRKGIEDNLRAFYEKAGIYRDGLCVHSLRHTCLTLLHREGVGLKVLKELAGHESIATTETYTHITNHELIAGMEKHPLG